MDDLLMRLEAQVQLLVQRCDYLAGREIQLLQEKEALLAKYNRAMSQIETMVSSLKSIEELA